MGGLARAPQAPRGGSERPGKAGAPLDVGGTLARYSRMVSNANLQPMGPSAFTALKPDMVS